MTGIVLLTPDTGFADRVQQALRGSCDLPLIWKRSWATHGQAVGEVADTDPDVVVVGPGLEHDDQLQLASSLDQRDRPAAIVVVGEITVPFALDAMRAGARDLIALDAEDGTLLEALERARAVVQRRRATAKNDQARTGARVITVLSPKGGTGKTTMSTNLAVGLARAGAGRVLLVDFDLQFGDVAGALGLEPHHTLVDAIRTQGLTATALKMFLTPHPSGLHVLAPPASLSEVDDLTADDLRMVLRLLAEEFPWIVIDTSAGIDQAAIVALEVSTDLVFVASTDVQAVRAVRREIEALDQIGMTNASRHLVLNRSTTRAGLEVDDIAANLGLPVGNQIPSSRQVPISTNQGNPILESLSDRDPLARAFASLVDGFLPDRAAQGDRRPASRGRRR